MKSVAHLNCTLLNKNNWTPRTESVFLNNAEVAYFRVLPFFLIWKKEEDFLSFFSEMMTGKFFLFWMNNVF